MPFNKSATTISTLFLASFFSVNLHAQANTPLSFDKTSGVVLSQKVELPFLDNLVLKERDAKQRIADAVQGIPAPYIRYAQPQKTSVAPKLMQWQKVQKNNGDTMAVWKSSVRSEGAVSLNLGFHQYHMPKGGALYIYTPDKKHLLRAFTEKDNAEHGQLWTPIMPGDELIIEANIPERELKKFKLELSSVNHGYVGSSAKDILDNSIMSGSCNIDVACEEANAWQDQVRSVAAYSTGAGLFCSGSAINNTAENGRPFFLTAHHCGINMSNAPSMVVYWNYENSTCREPGSSDSGGEGDGELNDFSTGAYFRASFAGSDFTLVELDEPIDESFNVFLAGWDATDAIPESAVGIHHPSVEEKRISFENDPLVLEEETFLKITDWDLGTTEPGSSGSPLFNSDKRIVGQLWGGLAACGNDEYDKYGRFHYSWNGGETDTTRLKTWLDADDTGLTAIDGMNANDSGPVPTYTPPPPTPTPEVTPIEDGVPVEDLASSSEPLYFSLEVPAKASTVEFEIINYGAGASDADLYVRYNALPSLDSYDCRPYTGSSDEKCTIENPQEGTYYVMIDPFIGFENLTLIGTITKEGMSGSNEDITLKKREWFYHSVSVPEGAKSLSVTTSGGTGDVDLYIQRGAKPTVGQYACRSWGNDNEESCVIENPEAGEWFIGVRGYLASENVLEDWKIK